MIDELDKESVDLSFWVNSPNERITVLIEKINEMIREINRIQEPLS